MVIFHASAGVSGESGFGVQDVRFPERRKLEDNKVVYPHLLSENYCNNSNLTLP
jgi:hypothetical protein